MGVPITEIHHPRRRARVSPETRPTHPEERQSTKSHYYIETLVGGANLGQFLMKIASDGDASV